VTIGLVVHPANPVRESVRVVCEWAQRQPARVVVRAGDAARVGDGVDPVSDEEFLHGCDVVLSLGGDGTMLGALRLVADRPVPVLGVNHGTIGFLVEIEPPELADALDRLVDGRYTLEAHACLDVRVDDDGDGDSDRPLVAFNDVVLTEPAPFRGGASVDLSVNGAGFGYYRCDAVVACTPTGSTAYNYNAGGPVVSPSAACVAITPVAPLSGIARSIVLGAEDAITLQASGGPLLVAVDGTPALDLPAGGRLTLALRSEAAVVVRFDAGSYGRRSRVKLSLRDLPLRPDQLLELIPPELRQHPG
jgi:NAD+ kinase